MRKKSSKGAVKIGVDCYARARWTPSSFAWRNNDGVKPEYKGLIDVCFEGGTVSHNESAIDFEWSLDGENYIAKWRPVVLQSESDDLQNKLGSEISAAMGSVGLTSKRIIDVLSEAFKQKPPFWNKSIQIFNCPCVEVNADEPVKKFTIKEEAPKTTVTVNIEGHDYLLVSHSPTVSPKEDNPMKPVYTAEMHAKGELPPVGVECSLKSGSLTQWFNGVCVGYDEEFAVFKMCDDYPFGCRYAGFCLDRIKPITKTIKVNGFDIPAPMSEAPKKGGKFFICMPNATAFRTYSYWAGNDEDLKYINRGLVHSTESAAIAHAKAMLGIDPNA